MIYENRLPTTVVEAVRRQDAGSILVRRWGACWIDMVLLGIFLVVPVLVLDRFHLSTAGGVISLILIVGYFPLTEGLWGRSLGKLALGLVVVNAKAGKPGLLRASGRTLTRVIEVNPMLLGGIPAGIIVAISKKRQRLGDMLAGTYVITKDDWERVKRSAAPDTSVFD
ncbi:RDD family protein [Caulobacter hibisci]|uniref:RDD family protein n=1 Tax=Caulobacter hibisci TaxID=2035993 RepID=A0ABS0SYR3_9CAUL|nr:RDD family protein [Caulobacter hibisci]MBI1684775.1 RDD family protein [Caulobacter hibisci]